MTDRRLLPPLWLSYLVVGAAVCGLYAFVPPFAGSGPVINLLGLSPVVAIVVGLHRHRPVSAGPWWCFAVGFLLFWLGDVYTYSYPRLLGADVPFPSIGDAFYVLVYPALMAGLLVLVRRRNPERDRAGLIDALIITLGLSLLSWVALIAPYLHDQSLSTAAKLVSIANPLGDILLLAAAIRLAVDFGKRQPAFYLMAASILALLVTDFVYGLFTLAGDFHFQVFLDVGWISFYLLWGAAALHPSMKGLEEPAPDREPRLTSFRLGLLTCASLIAPALELTLELRRGNVDLPVIIAASGILFALVVARMAGLVREQERFMARQRALSGAGATLVAATRREEIYAAALEAARSLLDQPAEVMLRSPAERAPADPATLVLELAAQGEVCSLLAVSGEKLPARPVRGALQALAAQVSLALDSAALTEKVVQRAGEERLSSLVQHSNDLITVLDRDGTVIYQSPSIQHVLGWGAEELVGTGFARLLDAGQEARLEHLLSGAAAPGSATDALECALRHRDGTVRHFEILGTDLLDDESVGGIVLNGRDVSERREFEEQLAHQAFHDPVTALANRALFAERVRHAVARMRRERTALAVIFLDLDDFKTINDSLGHAAGDRVLREVAERLDASVRASDTAARFGGDEFAVLLEDVASAQEAADTAERILTLLGAPLRLDGKELVVRASLGISVADGEAPVGADELLRDADAAMYIAKRDGKGGYRLFEPAMHEGVLARLEMRADLQRAIDTGQLELYYQPVVRLEDGSVSGFEALVRWRHPERGMVAPGEFIGLAEDMGLIVPIGRWVLREGCRHAAAIRRALPDHPPLSMAVNLSVKQLRHSDVAADVRDALEESGLDPGRLTIEITESVMIADTELAVQRLTELKELGVRLAMDDFGTGYSSLSYLSRLPVDILKMDRSFLRADATIAESSLATAVVGLGKALGLQVVAEGIELDAQWEALRALDCELGQGFLFARPMDADATLDYLRAVPHVPVHAA